MRRILAVFIILALISGVISLTQSCSPFTSQDSFESQASKSGQPATIIPIENRNQSDQATNGGGTVVGNPFTSEIVLKRDVNLVPASELKICVKEIYFSETKLVSDSDSDSGDWLGDPTDPGSLAGLGDRITDMVNKMIDDIFSQVFNNQLDVDQPETPVGNVEFGQSTAYRQVIMRASEDCTPGAPAVRVINSHGQFELGGEVTLTFNSLNNSEFVDATVEQVDLHIDDIYPLLDNVTSDSELSDVVEEFRGIWTIQ